VVPSRSRKTRAALEFCGSESKEMIPTVSGLDLRLEPLAITNSLEQSQLDP
jgi:hypothetical protein